MSSKVFRWLRLISVVVSAGVLAVMGYIFFRPVRSPADKHLPSQMLTPEVTSATQQVEYIEAREGRPSLRVLTGRNVSDNTGMNHLRQIRAVYYGKEGERTDSIDADECFSTAGQSQIRFEGNVRVQLTGGYTLRTPRMIYEKVNETAASDDPFTFTAPGIEGSGRGFILYLKSKEMHVHQAVNIRYTPPDNPNSGGEARRDPIDLTAGSAVFNDQAKRVTLKDDIRMKSAQSRLQGAGMVLELGPAREIRSGVCDGGARYEQEQEGRKITLAGHSIRFELTGDTHELKQVGAVGAASLQADAIDLTGQKIDILIAEGGAPDQKPAAAGETGKPVDPGGIGQNKVLAEGDVRLRDSVAGRDLSGQKMEATLDAAGKMRELIMSGGSRLREKAEKGEVQLDAATLRFFFRTQPTSAIERVVGQDDCVFTARDRSGAALRNHSRELVIVYDPAGRFPARADARGGSDGRFTRAQPFEDIRVESQSSAVDFFPATMDPDTFKAFGKVVLTRTMEKQHVIVTRSRELSGKMASNNRRRFQFLTQKGDFSILDGDRRATARQADYRDDRVLLTGDPVVYTAETATRAREFQYDTLSRALLGRDAVQTTYTPQPGQKENLVWFRGSTKGQPVYIRSDSVRLNEKSDDLIYEGSCRLTQGANTLTAGRLQWDRRLGTIIAENDVFLRYFSKNREGKESLLEIQSGRMRYLPQRRELRFETEVRSLSSDGSMLSDQLWAYFTEGGDLHQLMSSGNIRIRRGERDATGDRALYEPATGRTILVGDPARVDDRQTGRSTQGVQLTFYQQDDKITIESSSQLALPE